MAQLSTENRRRRLNFASWGLTVATGMFMLLTLVLFVRASRGLLGIALAGLAAVLILYWIREFRKTVKHEWQRTPPSQPHKDRWDYELVDTGDIITLVAVVPGPASEVEAMVEGRALKIHGGGGFRKLVKLPTGLRIRATSYVNGVLNVKLQRAKTETIAFDDASTYDSL